MLVLALPGRFMTSLTGDVPKLAPCGSFAEANRASAFLSGDSLAPAGAPPVLRRNSSEVRRWSHP